MLPTAVHKVQKSPQLLSFGISSFYAGVYGVLYTYYFGIANYEAFRSASRSIIWP
jgi:ABC-type branched-subunit amino acid transport system permease subunit